MQKQCSKCKEIYENAEENFYKVPRLKSGFSSWCKKCHYEKDLSYIKTEIGKKNNSEKSKRFLQKSKLITKPSLKSKICTHCKEEKEIIDFKIRPVNKDGYANQCKKCEYEICTDSRKSYIFNNWAKLLFLGAKRHSKYDFDIDEKFVSELYEKQNGKCFWFNVDLKPSNEAKYPWQPSLDRLDREKGYTRDNVVLACYSANIGRNTSDEATFSLFVEDLKKALSAKNNE